MVKKFVKLNANPDEINLWLQWAGKNLLAMPIKNPAPSLPRALWPDYPQDPNIIYNVHNIQLRPVPPSSNEIKYVDEILELILLIQETNTRRILQARCLIVPINNRFLFSWEKISRTLALPSKKIKSLHKKGLISIAEKIDEEKAERISKFFKQTLIN